MEVVLNLGKNKLSKDDILIYDGKRWIPIAKEELLKTMAKKISDLEFSNNIKDKRIATLEKKIEDFQNDINTRINNFIKSFIVEDEV